MSSTHPHLIYLIPLASLQLHLSMRLLYRRVGTCPMVPSLRRMALGQLDLGLGLGPRPHDDIAEQLRPQALPVGLLAVAAAGQQHERFGL